MSAIPDASSTYDVPARLVDQAVTLAERWASTHTGGSTRAERAATARLAALLSDPEGLDLALDVVDTVLRPEDPRVSARGLARLDPSDAAFLGLTDRALLSLGTRVGRVLPRITVPAARARMRAMVAHLVGDAEGEALTTHLARLRAEGFRPNVNLLGEAVLGERAARERYEAIVRLAAREDVDYVSVKISSLVPQLTAWEMPVEAVVKRLLPLYEHAHHHQTFLTLDMEEYRDLELTLSVFEGLLGREELASQELGIALQAYLPDAPGAFDRVAAAALRRVDSGGARVKVRLVKGANLPMERVEAERHGWPQAPHTTKAATDATYVRILERALTPEITRGVHLGVAGHNLYHLAFAHLLAAERGVATSAHIEMLQGMAPEAARAVRDDCAGRTGGGVVLYTPIVARDDFDLALAYLVRRLEEQADPENYLHQLGVEGGRARAEARFRASVADAASVSTQPRRRGEPTRLEPGEPFRNAADSDPTVPSVRERASAWLAVERDLTPRSPHLVSTSEVDAVVQRSRELAPAWAATPPTERAAVLAALADRIEDARGELVALMAQETGKTLGEADPEVSEAVDFARYYAASARELAAPPMGVRFAAVPVTLVTPPWNFPVAIALGGVLAALAAGSAVVMKPSPQATRCAEVVAEHVRATLALAGHEEDLLQVVRVAEDEVGRHLVAHQGIDQVVLTGAAETAGQFARWRTERPTQLPGGPRVFAETSGKNAIVVTPSCDLDLAVTDVVHSAFGHAGQKCSAASLVILVGSLGFSRRFHAQLLDAVTSLRVGPPSDPGTGMGPLVEVPTGKLRRALTLLDPGESWVVRPRELEGEQLDGLGEAGARWVGRLWTPGVRAGVAPGSWFHRTECFGPVLGVMRAESLAEAVEWQNSTGYGLTGGLHALDPGEIDYWLRHVEVGNAYVNRGITGAVVRRQPFGGWKGSVMGPGAKAGGPHYVAQLGIWELDDTATTRWAEGAASWWSGIDLGREVGSDSAVAARMRTGEDVSGLVAEENTLRYCGVPELLVRLASGGSRRDALRVLNAASALGVKHVRMSVDVTHGDHHVAAWLPHAEVVVETEERFAERVAASADVSGGRSGRDRRGEREVRLRWLGAPGERAPQGLWRAAAASATTIVEGPCLPDAALELHTLVREQAVSRTRHRYGHVHE